MSLMLGRRGQTTNKWCHVVSRQLLYKHHHHYSRAKIQGRHPFSSHKFLSLLNAKHKYYESSLLCNLRNSKIARFVSTKPTRQTKRDSKGKRQQRQGQQQQQQQRRQQQLQRKRQHQHQRKQSLQPRNIDNRPKEYIQRQRQQQKKFENDIKSNNNTIDNKISSGFFSSQSVQRTVMQLGKHNIALQQVLTNYQKLWNQFDDKKALNSDNNNKVTIQDWNDLFQFSHYSKFPRKKINNENNSNADSNRTIAQLLIQSEAPFMELNKILLSTVRRLSDIICKIKTTVEDNNEKYNDNNKKNTTPAMVLQSDESVFILQIIHTVEKVLPFWATLRQERQQLVESNLKNYKILLENAQREQEGLWNWVKSIMTRETKNSNNDNNNSETSEVNNDNVRQLPLADEMKLLCELSAHDPKTIGFIDRDYTRALSFLYIAFFSEFATAIEQSTLQKSSDSKKVDTNYVERIEAFVHFLNQQMNPDPTIDINTYVLAHWIRSLTESVDLVKLENVIKAQSILETYPQHSPNMLFRILHGYYEVTRSTTNNNSTSLQDKVMATQRIFDILDEIPVPFSISANMEKNKQFYKIFKCNASREQHKKDSLLFPPHVPISKISVGKFTGWYLFALRALLNLPPKEQEQFYSQINETYLTLFGSDMHQYLLGSDYQQANIIDDDNGGGMSNDGSNHNGNNFNNNESDMESHNDDGGGGDDDENINHNNDAANNDNTLLQNRSHCSESRRQRRHFPYFRSSESDFRFHHYYILFLCQGNNNDQHLEQAKRLLSAILHERQHQLHLYQQRHHHQQEQEQELQHERYPNKETIHAVLKRMVEKSNRRYYSSNDDDDDHTNLQNASRKEFPASSPDLQYALPLLKAMSMATGTTTTTTTPAADEVFPDATTFEYLYQIATNALQAELVYDEFERAKIRNPAIPYPTTNSVRKLLHHWESSAKDGIPGAAKRANQILQLLQVKSTPFLLSKKIIKEHVHNNNNSNNNDYYHNGESNNPILEDYHNNNNNNKYDISIYDFDQRPSRRIYELVLTVCARTLDPLERKEALDIALNIYRNHFSRDFVPTPGMYLFLFVCLANVVNYNDNIINKQQQLKLSKEIFESAKAQGKIRAVTWDLIKQVNESLYQKEYDNYNKDKK